MVPDLGASGLRELKNFPRCNQDRVRRIMVLLSFQVWHTPWADSAGDLDRVKRSVLSNAAQDTKIVLPFLRRHILDCESGSSNSEGSVCNTRRAPERKHRADALAGHRVDEFHNRVCGKWRALSDGGSYVRVLLEVSKHFEMVLTH